MFAEVTAWVLAPPPQLTYPAVVQLLGTARLQAAGSGLADSAGPAVAQHGASILGLVDVGMVGVPGNGLCELGEIPSPSNSGGLRHGITVCKQPY